MAVVLPSVNRGVTIIVNLESDLILATVSSKEMPLTVDACAVSDSYSDLSLLDIQVCLELLKRASMLLDFIQQ